MAASIIIVCLILIPQLLSALLWCIDALSNDFHTYYTAQTFVLLTAHTFLQCIFNSKSLAASFCHWLFYLTHLPSLGWHCRAEVKLTNPNWPPAAERNTDRSRGIYGARAINRWKDPSAVLIYSVYSGSLFQMQFILNFSGPLFNTCWKECVL